MVRGSITVFLSFSLLMILAVFFSLLESARVSGLGSLAQMDVEMTTDSLFAEYDRILWKDYGLLYLDGSYGGSGWSSGNVENRAMEFSSYNRSGQGQILSGKDFLQLEPAHMSMTEYVLATDEDGDVFRNQAACSMRLGLATMAIDELKKQLYSAESDEEAGRQLEENGTAAIDQYEHRQQDSLADQSASENSDGSADYETAGVGEEGTATESDGVSGGAISLRQPADNPLELLKELQKKGILAIVAPDIDLSSKEIDLSQTLLRRELAQGTGSNQSQGYLLEEGMEELLFLAFLEQHYSNAVDVKDGGKLDYELEYIICGKDEDVDNLKGVVNRLLLMREGANALFLETDPKSQAELEEVALAISTAALSPEFEPLVKQGILFAWAYVESLADVKVLLDGGKIPLRKSSSEWMTDIWNLTASFGQATSRDHSRGLSYVRYLETMMLLMQDKNLNYRSMDVLEQHTGRPMDAMAESITLEATYQGEALFWGLVPLGSERIHGYEFIRSSDIAYLSQGSSP